VRDAARSAGASLDQAKRDARAAAGALAVLPAPTPSRGEVVTEAVATTLNDTLAHTLVRVSHQAKARSVEIERITAASRQQGFAGADALSTPVPMTGGRVLAVRLSLHGRYTHYPAFKSFLDDLGHLAAIQSLKVTGDHFETVVEIYGASHV